MASVKVVEHGEGDHSVGFELDGVFIPVATIPAYRIEHYKERAKVLEQRAKEGDEAAEQALEILPTSASAPAKSKSEKGGGS